MKGLEFTIIGTKVKGLDEEFDLNSPKGRREYFKAKLVEEIFGEDKIVHCSIGDIVRSVHKEIETSDGKQRVMNYLNLRYRGYISVQEGIESILNRSQERVSVPDQ